MLKAKTDQTPKINRNIVMERLSSKMLNELNSIDAVWEKSILEDDSEGEEVPAKSNPDESVYCRFHP